MECSNHSFKTWVRALRTSPGRAGTCLVIQEMHAQVASVFYAIVDLFAVANMHQWWFTTAA
jgi:hypothetical protein